MNKSQILVAALIAFAAIGTTMVQAGIEVLSAEGIEVLKNGSDGIEVLAAEEPSAYYAEAVMTINGEETVVDAAPIDATGYAALTYPFDDPNNSYNVYDANGTLLSGGYVDGLEGN